jgi:hypothetical protein
MRLLLPFFSHQPSHLPHLARAMRCRPRAFHLAMRVGF